jgi:uncharacterized membrane protein YqgA involved in biofilm formation
MIGPYLNCAALILGGLSGIMLARHLPKRLQEGLPAIFALASISIGIVMVVKVKFMPAVVLALIFGTIVGEVLSLENGVKIGAAKIQSVLQKIVPNRTSSLPHQEFIQSFTAIIVLFCFGGMGVVGALTEGLTGDYQYLVVKAIMDYFTAMIFAISLGIAIITIAIPQFFIQASLYLLAKFIMPYMDEIAFADFSACGGIIMLAVGYRIAQIKIFSVVNFLPALIFVVPFSYLWRYLVV